ncbi:hypothetical protein MTO96_027484 [Rhipicephalus appendiculatus]
MSSPRNCTWLSFEFSENIWKKKNSGPGTLRTLVFPLCDESPIGGNAKKEDPCGEVVLVIGEDAVVLEAALEQASVSRSRRPKEHGIKLPHLQRFLPLELPPPFVVPVGDSPP